MRIPNKARQNPFILHFYKTCHFYKVFQCIYNTELGNKQLHKDQEKYEKCQFSNQKLIFEQPLKTKGT
jgi:hypothetical protein